MFNPYQQTYQESKTAAEILLSHHYKDDKDLLAFLNKQDSIMLYFSEPHLTFNRTLIIFIFQHSL